MLKKIQAETRICWLNIQECFVKNFLVHKDCFGVYISCRVLTSNFQLEAIWIEGETEVLSWPGVAGGGGRLGKPSFLGK